MIKRIRKRKKKKKRKEKEKKKKKSYVPVGFALAESCIQ